MRKTGRPKIEDDSIRGNTIKVRMNDSEVRMIDAICDRFKCDRSSVIRALVATTFNNLNYHGEMNANNS